MSFTGVITLQDGPLLFMNGVMGPLINGLINGYLGLFHPELNGVFVNLLITGDFAAHFVGNFSTLFRAGPQRQNTDA